MPPRKEGGRHAGWTAAGAAPLLWVVLGTPAALGLGLLAGLKPLLPLLAVAPFYPCMVRHLLRGERGRAVALGLLWALVLGVSATAWFSALPTRAEESVWNGAPYRDEMHVWLQTGRGAESDPSLFLPRHAGHAALFCLLCLATGGFLGILMGAALMDYMAFYVASLVVASQAPLLTAAAGWHPWSVIRVAAFVVLGVVCSEPLLRWTAGRRQEWRALAPWILGALGGLAADALLKWLMAEPWRRLLVDLLHGRTGLP